MGKKISELNLTFETDKPTKNTVRFAEDVDENKDAAVGMIYIKNKFVEQLGNPDGIEVTIRPKS